MAHTRAGRSVQPLRKFPTGILGLDEVFEGGIPQGRAVLVTGSTGVGKTLFLNEFLYRGLTLHQQNGVFVTFEETPVDIMRNVDSIPGQQEFVRRLFVRKMRGMGYRSGLVEFAIHGNGLEVYPKIPVNRLVAKTDFKKRKKFGIPLLDEALGGGIPQGHIVLVSGNTGTGKSLLGGRFLVEGFARGEPGIYINLEETVEQIEKTALAHGWDFKKQKKEGRLRFISPNPIDLSTDQVLLQIVKGCRELKAKRVFFDSISSLFSETMNEEKVRQFLLQINGFFKEEGITCLLSYLTAGNFGASKGQLLGTLNTNEMRLSSVVDGVLLLLYVERDQDVQKLMNVLKMRGTPHSRSVFQYEIVKGGLKIGERFSE